MEKGGGESTLVNYQQWGDGGCTVSAGASLRGNCGAHNCGAFAHKMRPPAQDEAPRTARVLRVGRGGPLREPVCMQDVSCDWLEPQEAFYSDMTLGFNHTA